MRILTSALLAFFFTGALQTQAFGAPPFSFEEIRKATLPAGPLFRMKMSDGIDLAYQYKSPCVKPAAVLVFIHGGGAYGGAGYQNLAAGLSEKYSTAVYLPDLRGHGHSGGPRGDAPSVERVWKDLKTFIQGVRASHPGIPVYLGGHSSGGGLVLNYATWNQKAAVEGYFFLAPEFGYKSKTARNTKNPFAKVRTWVFVASAISGGRLFGNTTAVYFNYPAEVLAAHPLMLGSITRNMAIALTPSSPQEQFAKLDKPFGLFAGERDELFLPDRIMTYAQYPDEAIRKDSLSEVVPDATHLSILLRAYKLIGRVIGKWTSQKRAEATG